MSNPRALHLNVRVLKGVHMNEGKGGAFCQEREGEGSKRQSGTASPSTRRGRLGLGGGGEREHSHSRKLPEIVNGGFTIMAPVSEEAICS